MDDPLFPVNLRLTGRRCLVVGGGRVAQQKVEALLEAGAAVHVVAPAVSDVIRALPGVTWDERPYREGDVAGYRLVITATGDREVDRAVYLDGETHGVWVNSADDPDHCAFTLPARLRRGRLLLAVSTAGSSPAVATWLRRRLEREIGPEYGELVELVAEERERIRAEGRSTEEVDWQRALDSGMLELIREGRLAEAKERLQACLSSSSA
ncbi:precorrin-2 dehydrogenase/sirohydrochlorin ferrochelatase family protein [Rhabdothermincola sediminis]|uniref:precorrin-2 dehydrogenase/sirohydrochlorin ferrochelatase family protein n=1 Tax=Rhabdothermincola sediminis TaxID=2751370 RepID=UPI001AA01A46|nr:bifunctional precorrin-2 dehydrogenase/sirohydrochlorin ferrochelatase [Rhabdothermincola sediminis]